MAFNFFKNHARQDTVNEHLGAFRDDFSDIQKKAILGTLCMIASIDDEFHPKEAKFLENTCKLFGYQLTDAMIAEIYSLDQDYVFQVLNGLKEGQKDWYIITALGMIYADGKVAGGEKAAIEMIFSRIGIDANRSEAVVKKMALLLEKFG